MLLSRSRSPSLRITFLRSFSGVWTFLPFALSYGLYLHLQSGDSTRPCPDSPIPQPDSPPPADRLATPRPSANKRAQEAREKALTALKGPAPQSVLKKAAQGESQPEFAEPIVNEEEGEQKEEEKERLAPLRKRLRQKGPVVVRQCLQD